MKTPVVLSTLVLLAYSPAAASTAAATGSDCVQRSCLRNYAPVCGSNGQTYANACVFHNAVCNATTTQQSPLTKLFDGACDGPTNPFCGLRCSPATELPVCGSDGATYANPCMFSAARCTNVALTMAHEGACAKKTEPKPTAKPAAKPTKKPTAKPKPKPKPTATAKACNDVCPMIFNPVCGSDAVTYSNPCLLSVAACKDKSLDLTTVHSGECSAPAPTPEVTAPAACAAVSCMQFSECQVDDATGNAFCADVCDPRRCAADEVCSLTHVQCFTTPCPPIATCTTRA